MANQVGGTTKSIGTLAPAGQNRSVLPRAPARLVRRLALALLIFGLLASTACTGPRLRTVDASELDGPPSSAEPGASSDASIAPPPRRGTAPSTSYAVGVRTITFKRSADRTLRTTIWYPAGSNRTAVAPGRFPLVVLSHGLMALPTDYQALATRWVRAGFVVVAPAYPHTSRGVKTFDLGDVVNQPADASYVIDRVLALDTKADDRFRGHLNTAAIGAAGHSAGAITTVGLFANGRDDRLDAGIVLAGNAVGMGRAYVGLPATLLFIHGDQDPITPYQLGRATYDAVPADWPKAFLTLPGERHIDPYLHSNSAAFTAVAATTTDFLRWTLYGDESAKARLARDAGEGTSSTATSDTHWRLCPGSTSSRCSPSVCGRARPCRTRHPSDSFSNASRTSENPNTESTTGRTPAAHISRSAVSSSGVPMEEPRISN